MTWTITIQKGGSRITVNTGLFDFDEALEHVFALYGDDVTVVSQETR